MLRYLSRYISTLCYTNNICLDSCKNSYFHIFHQNKCYLLCDNSPLVNISNGVSIDETNILYEKICKCEKDTTWYKNESETKTVICSRGLKDCNNFPNQDPFKDLVYSAWDCVDECQEDNPYFFIIIVIKVEIVLHLILILFMMDYSNANVSIFGIRKLAIKQKYISLQIYLNVFYMKTKN